MTDKPHQNQREQHQQLLQQVRTAHRLLAGFYQRLLPTIDQIAANLDLAFYAYEPKEFARPGQLTTNPFDRWQWDLLPGLSTFYLFGQFESSKRLQLGEYLVEFCVDCDTGVSSDANKGAEPDALVLPISVDDARSVIRVNVYAAAKNCDGNWHRQWSDCDWPSIGDVPTPKPDSSGIPLICAGFELPLESLMSDDACERFTTKIREFVDATVAAAKAHSS